MKVVIINHSDTLGGASVVSFRLMEALRAQGVDARMLVGHKNTTSPYVAEVGHQSRYKATFLAEHLDIFLHNGLSRQRLFQVSTAKYGLPLSEHPWVREADAVMLNWVNQGLLSLNEIGRIVAVKPTLWTMHDMWNMTGICHHAGECRRFMADCGDCPLLGKMASPNDLSHSTFMRKSRLYSGGRITFVAVSRWLGNLARQSRLLRGECLEVIPNAFPVEEFAAIERTEKGPDTSRTIIMGAARLDDPVKGLPLAVGAFNLLADRGWGNKVKVVLFGALRDPAALDGLRLPYEHVGMVDDPGRLRALYGVADIVVSSSLYETLPGTLIEGQASGCYPVSFGRGGQRDIIDHPSTGYIAPEMTAVSLAAGLEYALKHPADPALLRESVASRFSSSAVARSYISLLEKITATL